MSAVDLPGWDPWAGYCPRCGRLAPDAQADGLCPECSHDQEDDRG